MTENKNDTTVPQFRKRSFPATPSTLRDLPEIPVSKLVSETSTARNLIHTFSDSDRSLLGYARVSTADQDESLQLDAFKAAGVGRVWIDHASGGTDVITRPGFAALLDEARPGDTLVVWKLDRAGRSTKSLLTLLDDLEARSVAFRSLTEAIDTGTPSGRLLYSVLGAVASYERDLIRSRTRAGLDAARARGKVGGRPPALSDTQVNVARSMAADGESVTTIAGVLGVGRATIYRVLSKM